MGFLRNTKRTQFAVIGMGRFGRAMAKELQEAGNDVLIIDKDEQKANDLADQVTYSIIADATDENVLQSAGIKNMDVVIIGMGSSMESSILTTLNCKKMGVPYIVCKANNEKHKEILEKMGADLVVIPEVSTAKKMAMQIMHPSLYDVMNIQQDYSILEIKIPEKWIGKNLKELDLRNEDNLSVILVKKGEQTVTNPGGDYVFEEDDTAVIGIDRYNVEDFIEKIK